MNAKEYLQQAYYLDREIKLNIEKMSRMKSSLYGRVQGYQNNGGRKGNNYSSFENTVQKIIDYEGEINKKIDALVTKRIEIEGAINDISDNRQREILTRRYLLYQKWEEIAQSTGYEVSNVFVIHRKALKNFLLFSTVEL